LHINREYPPERFYFVHPGGIYILKKELAKLDPNLLFADGFDDCILGLTINDKGLPVVLYSSSKIIRSLSKDMPYEEAIEYFDFNIGCAYVGERTPVFLTGYLEEDDDT
jgi:hypothetical protein